MSLSIMSMVKLNSNRQFELRLISIIFILTLGVLVVEEYDVHCWPTT